MLRSATSAWLLVSLAIVCVSLSPLLVSGRRALVSHSSASYDGVLGESISIASEPRVMVEADSATQLPAVGQTCNSAGRVGVCKNVAQCSGQTASGLCAGSAAIKCCFTTAAAPASTAAATTSSSSGFIGGAACSVNGVSGKCGDKTACGQAGGRSTAGKCAGAANIQCCTFTQTPPATTTTTTAATATVTTATNNVAFVGGAACSVNGAAGKCGDKTSCTRSGGVATAGKCAGPANIQCCTFKAAAQPAAATSTSTSTSSTAPSCTYGGQIGSCGPRSSCAGTVYTGLCPGSATSVCCITGRTTAARTSSSTANKNRPKITLTSLQRLSESQHLAKWKRFKSLRGRTYATREKEQAAYLTFRENRVRVIWLNDNYGKGFVLWASTSPHMDVTQANFKQQKLNLRMPALTSTPIGRAFIEIGNEHQQEESAPQPADMSTPEWTAFMQLAESQFDNDFAAMQLDAQRADESQSALLESSLYAPGDSVPGGPVAPTLIGPGTARVTGEFIVDYRSIMQPIKNQGECGSSQHKDTRHT